MAIYPVRRDRLGVQYKAVRPVCWLCKAPLDNSARLQGRIYCTDCACGRVIRDVLRPSALKKRRVAPGVVWDVALIVGILLAVVLGVVAFGGAA